MGPPDNRLRAFKGSGGSRDALATHSKPSRLTPLPPSHWVTATRRRRMACCSGFAESTTVKKAFCSKDFLAPDLPKARPGAHYPRMLRNHTRKLVASMLRVGAACALLACAGAHAAMPEVHVRLIRADALASPQIGVYGTAAVGCSPQVARVTLDGTDLSIELQSAQLACDNQRTTPFVLHVDPAASAGVPILPGQVYRVHVYAVGAGADSLLAFHLLDTNTPTSAPTPEDGLWWSQASTETGAAAPGNGASIEFQDGQLAVGWLGFNDVGAATWYFGSARPTGRVASVALVQLANGDPPFAPTATTPSAQPGPRLEVEFLSPTRARAYLVRNEAGRDLEVRALTLVRSRFSSGPAANAWVGQWVLVPDDNGAPRVFEFTEPSSQDADTFHLADAGNDATLDCRLASGTQSPEVCTLSVATTALADFDQIGIDHLTGHSGTGARVKLLRVPR